ncbi:alpha-crystallin B chain-like [Ptychodera flava]
MEDRMRSMRAAMAERSQSSPGGDPNYIRGYYVTPMPESRVYQRQKTRQEDTKDMFRVMLDVHHFTPEEIEVKLTENKISVHAKHEDKEDEHGFVSREFTRQYILPPDTDLDQIKSHLSKDGIMTLEAPKLKAVEGQEEIPIPIPIKREEPKPVEGAGPAE